MHMKAVLFDLDGTLLNRELSLVNFIRWQVQGMLKSEVINQNKFIERFIELDANGHVWKDKVYSTLIKEFSITGWSVSELLASYELCFCAFSVPIEGAIEAVNSIKSLGLKVALVSNGKSPFQERNFNALGISHLFDEIFVSESVGLRKPEKEIFELACKHLGVKTSKVVFVGDSVKSDIDGANNAGIFSILISKNPEQQCPQASAIFSDYRQLLEIVQNAKQQAT